jgi:glycosidase
MKKVIALFTIAALGISAAGSSAAQNIAALATNIARGAQSDESAYFVMTDRYANGDTTNDNGGVKAGAFDSGFEPSDYGMFHGGDFKGITNSLDRLKKLGFTSIWVTPPVKQLTMQGNSAAYHGYWGLDFTTVDPHLGSEYDFKELVVKAHAIGMKVIIDIVVNHTADVIQYSDNNSYVSHKSAPYLDAAGKPIDLALVAGKDTFPKLDANISFAKKPSVDAVNANIKKPAFLNDITNYHNRGDSNWSGTSVFDGDFFGLDDVFTEKPEVVKGWIEVWSTWITKFGIDGYRIDTAKHVNPEFWKVFIPAILKAAKAAGKTDFPIYGEIFDSNPLATAQFVRNQAFPGVLDFAFQSNVTAFVTNGRGAEKLVELFNADDLYTTSTTSAYGLTTFLGNHDMGRIGAFIDNAASNEADALAKSKLANALLFLLRGGPALYYGDEKGMTGSGGDKAARQDMFPTQVSYWQDEKRIGSDPIGTRSAFDVRNPLEDQITSMQAIIKANPALRSGTQQIRFNNSEVFATTRYLNGQEYAVVFNSGETAQEVKFNVSTSGSKWTPILGTALSSSVSGANLTVKVGATSYVVLKAATKFKAKLAPAVTLNAPRSDFAMDYLLEISSTVKGDEYNQVTYLVREAGKNWVNIGTSDHRTVKGDITSAGLYRVFLEPRNYANGTNLEFVSIVKNAANKTAVSKIIKYKVSY